MPSTKQEREAKAEIIIDATFNKTESDAEIVKVAQGFIFECYIEEDWDTADTLLYNIIYCAKFPWQKLNLTGTKEKNPTNILDVMGQREYIHKPVNYDILFISRLSFFCDHLAEDFKIADIKAYFDEYYLAEHGVESAESKMAGLTINEHHQ